MRRIHFFKKCRFVRNPQKKSIFMLENFANNRNFAIFAPHLAYEVQ
jgi:hypothetical protein